MNENNGALEFESLLTNKKFLAAVAQNEKAVRGMSDNVLKEGNRLDVSFSGIAKSVSGVLGPISALTVAFQGIQWVKQAKDFENAFSMAMREVQTISKAVQEDFEGISDAISDLAARSVDDAIKLTNAFYQIVSAGYDGQEGLRLLEISTKAATAGLTDTTTAANGLTTVLNAWGLGLEQADKVADTMFKTVERGKTTFGELASSIAQVAPLAASNNIAFEEIFAAIQSITKQGTPTAQAMTQIRSSIINLNKVLGDGWSSVMSYQDGLNKVAEMAGGSQNKLKELIPDVEGVNAVLALTGEKARGAAEDLNETTKAIGAMETAHSRMMEEVDNKWAQVYNKWQRKLEDIGEAAKAGSGYIADFLNVLLTDTQADIIDPKAKEVVDGVAQSIAGITDKDEKLAAIIAKINELKNKRIGELNPEAAGWEKAQPGWLQRQVETLNAGMGLGSWATSGRVAQAEFDYVNNQIAITQQAEEGLMKLFAEVSNAAEVAEDQTEAPITKIRTLKDMLDDLKAEQGKLGAGTMEDDVLTLSRIQAFKQEIKGYYDELRKLQQDARVPNINPISAGQLAGGVSPIKKAELEFSKLNKKIEEGNKKAAKMRTELDGMMQQERLEKMLDLTTEISWAVENITQKYAEQLGLTEEQSKVLSDGLQAMSGIADIASGNVVQGAAKLVDSAISLFVKTPEKLSDHFVNVQEQVEKILNSVNIAAQALSNLNVDASLTSIKILKAQLNDLAGQAQKLNDELAGGSYQHRDGDRYGSTVLRNIVQQAADLNAEIENLSNRLLQGGLSTDQRDSINAVLESYNGLMSALNSTIEGIIGTSVEGLRESLADAFFEAEDAAKAWGDTVNDIIANITKKQLTAKLLTTPIEQAVNQLLNDYSDGTLSTDDIKRFQDAMSALYTEVGPAFEEAIAGLKELGIDLGSDSVVSGLSGSIGRAITEETASELVGLWNRTALDTRAIRDYSRDALDNLAAIQLNTANTVSELRNAVNRLDKIVANTQSSGSRI